MFRPRCDSRVILITLASALMVLNLVVVPVVVHASSCLGGQLKALLSKSVPVAYTDHAIRVYTGHAYQVINPRLEEFGRIQIQDGIPVLSYTLPKGDVALGEDLLFAKILKQTLQAMPAKSAESQVFRGIHKSKDPSRRAEFSNLYKAGNVFSNRAFLSSSESQKVAAVFATTNAKTGELIDPADAVLLSIKSSSARDIQKFAVLPDEKEWLIPPGGIFKVQSVGKKTIPTLKIDTQTGTVIRGEQEVTYIEIQELSPSSLSPEERAQLSSWAAKTERPGAKAQGESHALEKWDSKAELLDLSLYSCKRNVKVPIKTCLSDEFCQSMGLQGAELSACAEALVNKWTKLCGADNPSPAQGGKSFDCVVENYLKSPGFAWSSLTNKMADTGRRFCFFDFT